MHSREIFPWKVTPQEAEQLFCEPLADIFIRIRKKGVKLTEAELEYVSRILIEQIAPPAPKDKKNQLHLSGVSEKLNRYWLKGLSPAEALQMADNVLLLTGFFRASVRGGRDKYPVQFYAETAQSVYLEFASLSGARMYERLSDHFGYWLSALWLLANVLRRRRLDRYIIDARPETGLIVN